MGGTLILEYLSGMGWVACEKERMVIIESKHFISPKSLIIF